MSNRRVAICGNDSFPLDAAVGAQVVDLIRDLGDCTLLTRKRPAFDRFVQSVAIVLGLRCLTYDAEGGRSNVSRDSVLVRDCTEMHAFFTLGEFEQGRESGTLWLVERALSAGKPVTAYSALDGALIHVGSPAEEAPV